MEEVAVQGAVWMEAGGKPVTVAFEPECSCRSALPLCSSSAQPFLNV